MKYHYHLVDVFTTQPFGGNQLAVFPDADGLSGDQMQRIANELNLSETSFVFPPVDSQNDFHVRFFTPKAEIPMAGHPTVGTAYVLAKIGKITGNRTIFEEGVGPIPVKVSYTADKQPDIMQMSQPMPRFGKIFEDRDRIANLISIRADELHDPYPVQIVSTGVPFLYIPVRSLQSMGKLKLRLDLWEEDFKGTDAQHIFAFSSETQHPDSTVHSRMFAPAFGITEDPATGAASGPLGAYLARYEITSSGSIISEQGIEMGRPSYIHIDIEYESGEFKAIHVGGKCVYMGQGWLEV